MFIVRNERLGIVSMHALVKDAYQERAVRMAQTGESYTVSYSPTKAPAPENNVFNLVDHLNKAGRKA